MNVYKLCWICFVLLVVGFIHSTNAKPKGKKTGKAKAKAKTVHSGASAAGATKWYADSPSTIYTDIDVSYLNFDRTPRYFCSVSTSTSHLLPEDYQPKEPYVFSPEAAILMNVTGKYLPRKASPKGFRVRLKYKAEDGRNLTVYTAKNWRVRWVAIMDDHPIMLDLYKKAGEVQPSYLSDVSYIKMLQALVKEEPAFVEGLFGRDYQLPLSKIPKPKPKPVKVKVEKKEGDTSGKAETSTENTEQSEDSAVNEEQVPEEVDASQESGEPQEETETAGGDDNEGDAEDGEQGETSDGDEENDQAENDVEMSDQENVDSEDDIAEEA